MNPHKPKIVAGRVKKSPSTVAILNTSGKTFYNGGITIDSKANAENIREISRKLGYNILQDASFVYVPSSYGENKNFSQNSSLNNLVLYSEDFTNAVWTKSFTTISSNTTANPIDGKITASRLIEGSGNNNFRLYESIISTTPTNTFSIYIKKYTGIVNEKQYGYVRLASYSIGVQDSSFTTVVDLQNGIITDTKLYTGVGLPIGNISYSLVDAITYWRISITTTNTATILTPLYCECGLSNSATPIYVGNLPIYTGNSLSYITVWGAQFQTGTTVTTYQRTTDGIIDLNFTRATSARVTNKQGIVEDSCYNLFTWSQDFENAAWVKEHTTITPNVVVAPNGTLTADKMIISDNTSNSWNRIYNQLNYPTVAGSFYTASFYVKKGELDYLMVRDSQSSGPSIGFTVNLNNAQITQGYYDGNVASTLPTTYSATIDSNGWIYVKYTYTPSTNATTFWRYLSNSVNTTTVVNMSGASTYLWGQQLEVGSTARPYLRTTTRLNVPKLDYGRTISKPSLLIEPQRTNLLLQSTFNGSWSSDPPSTTIIPNYTIALDGTLSAAKLTESQFSSPQDFYQPVSASANQPYTFSVYAKAAERNYLRMTLATTSVGSGVDCYFDLSNGVIANGPITVPTVNNVSAFIYNAGNGWYRCSVTVSFIGATTMYAGIWTRQIPNGNSYLGTLGYGFYIWGAQVEAGLNATSYIPTVGAQVTRNIESSYVDLFNNNMLNQSGFTLYWEGYLYDGQTTNMQFCLSDTNTAAANTNQIGWTGAIQPFYNTGNTRTNSINSGINNYINKFAIQYSAGTANFYLNGYNVFSGKTVPIFNNRYLVLNSGNSTFTTDKIILWNRTLNNNDCSILTNILSINDIVPLSTVTLSLRKLNNNYNGSCIRVRRSSDNSEQDIGFVNGIIDTVGLLSFVGVGDGFVKVWYDQSINNISVTQTINANQPKIVSSGSVITLNGKTFILFNKTTASFFNISTNLFAGGYLDIYYVSKLNSFSQFGYIPLVLSGSLVWQFQGSTVYNQNINTPFSHTGTLTNTNLINLYCDSSRGYIGFNGVFNASLAYTPITIPSGIINGFIGHWSAGNSWDFDGYMSEMIIFNSTQNFKSIINLDIKNYYGL